MTPGRSQLVPALTVVFGSSLWGLLWIPLRGLEESGLGALWAVALFHLPAFMVTCAVFAVFAGASRGRNGPVALAGTLAGASIATYCLALILTSVIRATMLFYLTPVWGTLFGMLWLGERPGPARILVLVLGTTGLLLLLGAIHGGLDGGIGAGDALGLASGIFWAMAATVLKRHNGLPVTGVNFYQYLTTVTTISAVALLLPSDLHGGTLGDWELDAEVAAYLVSSAVILGSTYAILHALSFLSPGRSGLLMMSEVIVAVFSASWLLPEERLELTEWIGAGVIVAAALLEIAVGEPERDEARAAAADT